MPIAYSIEKRNGIILEVWTGEVSAMDLAAHWKRLLADPDALALRRTLVDVRNCAIAFSGDQLFEVIRTVAEPGLDGKEWRSALLVASSFSSGCLASISHSPRCTALTRSSTTRTPP